MKNLQRILYVLFVGSILIACAGGRQTWVDFEGRVPGRDELQLKGILRRPKGGGPFPAVVMLSECAGVKGDAKHLTAWAKRFTDWGYVALQVDSFGPRGLDEGICGRANAVDERVRSYDAHWAKTHLAKQDYVDPNHIAVIGWSHGGWTVMALADGSRSDDAFPTFQAAVAFYPYCMDIGELGTPLLILAGSQDEDTPASRCAGLPASAGVRNSPYELVVQVYADATHLFDVEGLKVDRGGKHYEYNQAATEDAIVQVRAFLAKYLKPNK